MKLLAVDIGNTNITFGIFAGKKIVKRFFIPTKEYCPAKLRKNLAGARIEGAIICSVVPKATKNLAKDLTKTKPLIVGKDIKVPIKNLYRRPAEVGQDRLVNAYAGVQLYGAPLIAIDFGTAVTFDVISKKEEYLGGMILPGLKISLEALAEKTALLPKIKLEIPGAFIGRDTKTSILSGIVYGLAALTDELTERIKNEIGKNAKVIGTGGNIAVVAGFCKKIDEVDPDLTLKGLYLLWRNRSGGDNFLK